MRRGGSRQSCETCQLSQWQWACEHCLWLILQAFAAQLPAGIVLSIPPPPLESGILGAGAWAVLDTQHSTALNNISLRVA